MDIKQYPPLALLSKSEQPGREFADRKIQLMNIGITGADRLNAKSYIDMFLSDDFMNPNAKNRMMQDLNRAFFLNVPTISQFTGCSKEELFADGAIKLQTEIKDLYLAPVLIEEWSKSKQVYKPDPDFAKALLRTQKLQLTKDMMTHLPYDYFYVDLMDVEIFNPVVGVFVFINHNTFLGKPAVSISIYLLTGELVYFSHYYSGYYNSKGIIDINFDEIPDVQYNVWNREKEIVYDETEFHVSRNAVSIFILQLLSYLSIEKPQIEESEHTKGTYVKKAPGSKIKNKWNEVQIFDVGVTYGKTYRKQMAEFEKWEYKEGDGRHHKSPVPHMRCAHWQRYWVGKGRTECKVNWIEPTFVGAKDSSNVVIHEVKENIDGEVEES